MSAPARPRPADPLVVLAFAALLLGATHPLAALGPIRPDRPAPVLQETTP